MEMRLAGLKAACEATERRVRALATEGRQEAAVAAAEAALVVCHALLADDADAAAPGWLRAARLLADLDHAIALDVLATTRGGHCLIRLAALRDLPDIASIGAMSDVLEHIHAAITIGAPRYNAGDIRGCCTVYWATQQALLAAPVFRGIAGYARAMAPIKTLAELSPPALSLDDAGIDALAWELRRAFDATLALIGR